MYPFAFNSYYVHLNIGSPSYVRLRSTTLTGIQILYNSSVLATRGTDMQSESLWICPAVCDLLYSDFGVHRKLSDWDIFQRKSQVITVMAYGKLDNDEHVSGFSLKNRGTPRGGSGQC